MQRAVFGFIFLVNLVCSSTVMAHEITAEFCRRACDSGGYAGWCISLGTGAKKFTAPYNAILNAAMTGSSQLKVDNCDRNIKVTNSEMTIVGSSCSLTQLGTDLELLSNLPSLIRGTIVTANGALEVKFTANNPESGYKTSAGSSFGPVSFVTTKVIDRGDRKVIWGNGDVCFSGFASAD